MNTAELIQRVSELSDRDPDAPPASEPSTNGEAGSKVSGIPDDTPPSLARIVNQATDRSAAHHAFVVRCIAAGLTDDQTLALVKLYRPSVDKYGSRLATEVPRSVKKARAWLKQNPDVAAALAAEAADDGEVHPSFNPVDLVPVLAGEVEQPAPTLLRRDDGRALFYAGMVNGIHGDSGIGKGWTVCHAITQELTAGNNVVLLDLEDVAASIVSRLLAMSATAEQIARHVTYIRPQEAFSDTAVHHLCGLILERSPTLVVIDSLGEAFGLEGINEDKDVEVGPWLKRVARVLAEAGPAIVLVDHSTKAADNPLHPSGSKRKRAAIGGASYLVTATTAPAKGKPGRLRLTCAKDRHGNYARAEIVGHLAMVPEGDTGIRTTLYAPNPTDEDVTLPVELAARAAVKAAKTEGTALSQNALLGNMKVKAAAEVKRGGIDLAVARGALVESAGPNRARMFTYTTELPEASGVTE